MKITYIGHSGFAVEYEDVAFIFDYYKGKLPEFKNVGKIYVFASHNHFDHFTEEIFSWISDYPEITYILSDDIEADGPEDHVKKIGPDQTMDVDDIHIKTLRSTDEGVAFFLSVNRDTAIRTYNATTCTSNTIVGMCWHHKRIAVYIYLSGCQHKYVARTCFYTKLTSFATVGIDNYGTFNFTHITLQYI